MGIGISVFLLAVGAVLTFALESDGGGGVNLDTIGVILMVAGAIGLLTSMLIFGRADRGGATVVHEERL